jgi:hypothetical protein
MNAFERKTEATDFVSPASFWLPDAIVESAWHEHAPFAFWLMDALRPRVFVELGSHHGFSHLAFCQAAERLGLETKGYAIDTWQGDKHVGVYDNEVYERLRDYHEPRYGHFSRLVRSTFNDALEHFSDGSIDLLHIDGCHFYDDVRRDFESWLPKLSDRAIVLFHDTNVREHGFGVFRYWAELCSRYPSFEFLHGHGLGVLGVGEDFSMHLRPLLQPSPDSFLTRQVREVYARLGGAIGDRYNTEQRKIRVVKLEGDLADAAVAQQHSEDQIAIGLLNIQKLEAQILEDEARIVQLGEEMRLVLRAREDADKQAVERIERIAELEHTLADAAKQIQNYQKSEIDITVTAVNLSDLQRKIDSSRWLIRTLGRKLTHVPRDISRRARRSIKKRLGFNSSNFMDGDNETFKLARLQDARYRKYFFSRLALRLKPILPSSFAERMRRRMIKNRDFSSLPVISSTAPTSAAPADFSTLPNDPLRFFRIQTLEEEVREWRRTSGTPKLISADAIAASLQEKLIGARFPKLVVAISHDNFTESVGGVQLCMLLEQQQVTLAGGVYLSLHPWQSLPKLADFEDDPTPVLGIVLDGTLIGYARADVIEAALNIISSADHATEAALVIHSLLGHTPEVIAGWAKAITFREAYFWLHDYSASCPGYNLLRNRQHYCGAPQPGASACGICVFGEERRSHLPRLHSLFDAIDFNIVSPSDVALNIWKRNASLRHLRTITVPHCEIGRPLSSPPVSKVSSTPINVAFIGGRSRHKGWDTFHRLWAKFQVQQEFAFHHFATAKKSIPGLNFHFIQVNQSDPQVVSRALFNAEIDIVIQWSIWPETFSFTTYEAIAAGALVLTNTFSGNVAAAGQKYDACRVFENEEELFAFFASGEVSLAVEKRRNASKCLKELQYSRMTAELLFKEKNRDEHSLLHELLV